MVKLNLTSDMTNKSGKSCNDSRTLLYHLIAFIVVAIWGSTFVFTKLLLISGLSPAHIFTLRFLIAYVLMLVFSLCQKNHRWFSASWKDEGIILLLGITGGSLYFLTENEALNHTTTTNTSLIVCLCPLFAATFIGAVYQSERLRPRQVFGTVMAALGVVVVVLNGHFVLHLSPVGDALAFTACICWAFYSLLMIPAGKRYNAMFITRKVFFYGLLSMGIYYAVVPDLPPAGVLQQPRIILNLLFLGSIASMLCFLAWTWIMEKLGAVTTTNYVYFNPVVTILFAWWILAEHITIYFLLGTLLILVGMYLADKKA